MAWSVWGVGLGDAHSGIVAAGSILSCLAQDLSCQAGSSCPWGGRDPLGTCCHAPGWHVGCPRVELLTMLCGAVLLPYPVLCVQAHVRRLTRGRVHCGGCCCCTCFGVRFALSAMHTVLPFPLAYPAQRTHVFLSFGGMVLVCYISLYWLYNLVYPRCSRGKRLSARTNTTCSHHAYDFTSRLCAVSLFCLADRSPTIEPPGVVYYLTCPCAVCQPGLGGLERAVMRLCPQHDTLHLRVVWGGVSWQIDRALCLCLTCFVSWHALFAHGVIFLRV